ncbi:MAG: transposase family protein [Desulfuromonadales bacterium]|nr:transposase family protein [Desulfuromonadales bacterium]
MDQKTFFSATLGLYHPWEISTILFSKDEKRLDITICFDQDHNVICPTCGKTVEVCDAMDETWHHTDFFSYQTYLHASVPQMKCTCHGILKMEHPWTRDGSRFVLVSRDGCTYDNPAEESASMS